MQIKGEINSDKYIRANPLTLELTFSLVEKIGPIRFSKKINFQFDVDWKLGANYWVFSKSKVEQKRSIASERGMENHASSLGPSTPLLQSMIQIFGHGIACLAGHCSNESWRKMIKHFIWGCKTVTDTLRLLGYKRDCSGHPFQEKKTDDLFTFLVESSNFEHISLLPL